MKDWRSLAALLTTLCLLVAFAACGDSADDEGSNSSTKESRKESTEQSTSRASSEPKVRGPRQPDRVTVRMMVLPCAGGRLGFGEKPSPEDALARAQSLLEEARGGADFAALVAEHSADPAVKTNQGLRTIANWGVEPDGEAGERPRAATPALADQAFALEVDAYAVVAFDPEKNPLGVIVCRRLR